MQKVVKKVVLTGGGTAGHIWPTLIVAGELEKQNPKIKFIYIGSKSGLEAKIIPGTKYKFYGISTGKLRRYFSFQNFLMPFQVLIGFFQALKILAREKPDVIFAKGGYVTVPTVLAGWFLKIPAIIHESDSVLGLANRFLSRFARKIATAYPSRYYPKKYQRKIFWSGLPTGKEFFKAEKNKAYQVFGLSDKLPIVLVFGGSQGAAKINYLVSRILKNLLEKCQLIHITGSLDFEKISKKQKSLSSKLKERYKVFEFLSKEMPLAFKVADLLVCRCGANSLAEIAALKKAAILIPLPTSASNHQFHNAQIFKENRAAQVLTEDKIKPSMLAKKILDLISRPFLLKNLRERAGRFYKPDAAKILAREILKITN